MKRLLLDSLRQPNLHSRNREIHMSTGKGGILESEKQGPQNNEFSKEIEKLFRKNATLPNVLIQELNDHRGPTLQLWG